jgi:site-specific DNA-methyltransferase (adenine-specific)
MLTDLRLGDCLDVLRSLPEASVDAVVTDPPYGLSFMGKRWDYDVPSVEVWAECLRVLKPGGHLLAFAGTRTQHRMAVRIEDAGFDIRDMIAWVYGSGFPKSHNLDGNWQGWGTALKPALEPITVARKPLVGSVAANVLEHGTGALNVDGCRVNMSQHDRQTIESASWVGRNLDCKAYGTFAADGSDQKMTTHPSGRWPANLIHDGSEEVVGLFPDGAKPKAARSGKRGGSSIHGSPTIGTPNAIGHWPADEGGSAARFFYCAKASKADRGEGNLHPTVKPTDLMRYLCRLVTPPGGVVLDPFMGSGSTGKAAVLEGFRFLGIEREESYLAIAKARIDAAVEEASKQRQGALFAP